MEIPLKDQRIEPLEIKDALEVQRQETVKMGLWDCCWIFGFREAWECAMSMHLIWFISGLMSGIKKSALFCFLYTKLHGLHGSQLCTQSWDVLDHRNMSCNTTLWLIGCLAQ